MPWHAIHQRTLELETPMNETFATPEDYARCERIHRQFGTTYYFATRTFPKAVQNKVHAVYGFVRVPDEWVDNPGPLTRAEVERHLDDWRRQLLLGLEGRRPDDGVMRAFVDTVRDCGIPVEEPLVFLDAMRQDLDQVRYETYEDLQQYMRGSASAVGAMMDSVMADEPNAARTHCAHLLGEAMQMTNFLRDIGEDGLRGRIYLPKEDLDRFAVSEGQVREGRFDPAFRRLMEFEIARTRELYAQADEGIPQLPRRTQRAILLARVLYSRILDRLEEQGCNPFLRRARTSRAEKLGVAMRVLLAPGSFLNDGKDTSSTRGDIMGGKHVRCRRA